MGMAELYVEFPTYLKCNENLADCSSRKNGLILIFDFETAPASCCDDTGFYFDCGCLDYVHTLCQWA